MTEESPSWLNAIAARSAAGIVPSTAGEDACRYALQGLRCDIAAEMRAVETDFFDRRVGRIARAAHILRPGRDA